MIKRKKKHVLSAFKELNHINEHYNIILHATERCAKVILKRNGQDLKNDVFI